MTKTRGLTDAQRAGLLEAMNEGLSLRTAARKVGVAASTVGQFYQAHRPPGPPPEPATVLEPYTPRDDATMSSLAIPVRNQDHPPTPEELAEWEECKSGVFRCLRNALKVEAVYQALPKEERDDHIAAREYLTRIRDKKLYRWEYPSYEACVKAEFGISASFADRQVFTFRLTQALPADLPKPTSESQVRSLRSIRDPGKRAEVYRSAVEAAGGNEPTTVQVEVAVAKAKGIIAANATVEVTEAAPEDDPETLPAGAKVEPTEEEWLATLPARGKIPAGPFRDRFDADALFYRAAEGHREKFRQSCRPAAAAAEKAMGPGHKGRFLARYRVFFQIQAPQHWQACGDCDGACVMPVVGECPTCRGAGYHVH